MSICDKCVHREVCCDEGMGEEALKFCAHLLEERPKGKWLSSTDNWYHTCSECKREILKDSANDSFCPNCGADMRSDV